MSKLAGKVALITGAGQGVGLGIAQTFASAGASLVITGRDEAKLRAVVPELESRGARTAVCVANVRQRDGARRAVQLAIERFGALDVLVNNASSVKSGVSLEDHDDEAIALTLESGLFGTIYHMQEAFPHLKQRGGSIINFGSRQGIVGAPGFAIYAASKEGIRGLSRAAAREWGPHRIRVNVIVPAALSPAAKKFTEEFPEQAQTYLKEVSLGHFGDCEKDIGPAALFFASDDSRYVTGQTLAVDGGMVML
jgi:NAD(P)-dependent dehydrogenase (short-subunit alcohol dehydrogenase family)